MPMRTCRSCGCSAICSAWWAPSSAVAWRSVERAPCISTSVSVHACCTTCKPLGEIPSIVCTRAVTTIEGISPNGLHVVQQAWTETDVEMHGARSTLRHATAELGAHQAEQIAEHPQERHVRIGIDLVHRSVHFDLHREASSKSLR